MATEQHTRRLHALQRLSARLANTDASGMLEESLTLLVTAVGARGGSALLVDDRGGVHVSAERGLGNPAASFGATAGVRASLKAIAEQAARSRRSLLVRRAGAAWLDRRVWTSVCAAGFSAALAVLVRRDGEPLAVMVLLFAAESDIDSELPQYAESFGGIVGMALERELDRATSAGFAEQEAMTGGAGLGPHELSLVASTVARELEGPVSALALQVEEQLRLMEELRGLHSVDPVLQNLIDQLGELTDDARAATTRVRQTTANLAAIDRTDSEPQHLCLSRVVRDSLAAARPELERRGITLSEALDSDPHTIGRADNLGQVVVNLLFNAADASEHAPDRRVSVRVSEDGDRAILVVDDSGPGVPPDQVDRIFKPFYSTKSGRRTGLGLKVCRDVVAAHGGHIEVVNRAEGGASFRVYLPRVADESGVHPVDDRAVAEPERAGPYRVFLVEDDEVFARAVRRALKPHEVRYAATAAEAEIALIDKQYVPDLILCSLLLPGRNGDALHARVRQLRPELADRFVFTSSGGFGADLADYVRRSGRPTLSKPLDMELVREYLESLSDSVAPCSVRTLSQPEMPAVRRDADELISSLPPTTRGGGGR